MNYHKISQEIKDIAFRLLADKEVELVLGFGKEKFSGQSTPLITSSPEKAREMIFDENCAMMLANYLREHAGKKVAIIAKPCETRAIVAYLAEDLLVRDRVTIIGIQGCTGVKDNTACQECTVREPVLADYTVGEPLTDEVEAQDDLSLEEMSPQERLEYFREEFSRCIRCYACREACYACYCPVCFTDSNRPRWVEETLGINENFTFHLMRSLHMAGRCINCGACEVACPEGIDVRALAAKLYRVSRDLYSFEPGMDPEEKTLFATYDSEDPQPRFID